MGIILQGRIVRIRVRSIATAIDITLDTGIDTHGITAIDLSGDIITTIDIVDLTTLHQHTRCQSGRELIPRQLHLVRSHLTAI